MATISSLRKIDTSYSGHNMKHSSLHQNLSYMRELKALSIFKGHQGINMSLIVPRVKFEPESSSSHESSSSQVKFSFFFLVVLFLIAV